MVNSVTTVVHGDSNTLSTNTVKARADSEIIYKLDALLNMALQPIMYGTCMANSNSQSAHAH